MKISDYTRLVGYTWYAITFDQVYYTEHLETSKRFSIWNDKRKNKEMRQILEKHKKG